MRTIAIITARGGSKRIPKKNIKSFCGKPIIAYSIEAALDSDIFDEVMVSTDDENIAAVARQYGASVPFLRSEATSGDYATTTDVLLEVLEKYQEAGTAWQYACCIYPTAPFVTAEKLRHAIQLLENSNANTVLPVVRFSFPPQRGVTIQKDKIKPEHPECYHARSQDLEPVYHDCGQFYSFQVDRFLRGKKLVTENTIPIIMPELEVQDIDNLDDWKIAEIKYRMLQKKQKPYGESYETD